MTQESVLKSINEAVKPEETLEQAVERLAALSPLQYERVRGAEAKKLDVRAGVLDKAVIKARQSSDGKQSMAAMFPDIEPWPHPVNGAALLNEIHATIKRFIICDDETAIAATLWIAFTWFIDRVQVAPLAIITAPEKRCGKSQLLSLIGLLSRRSLVASNISPAAIFRVVEAHNPTLLIDEADSFLRDNEEARGIINSGHTRPTAYVIRVVGDDHEPKQFTTWGAKAICGIGSMPETLMDRAVILQLRRKLPHEKVERLRHADPEHFEDLTSKLARFAEGTGEDIERARPALPNALNDRAQDNWEPLLAVADTAGGAWPGMARKAALQLSGTEQEAVSRSAELLADIHEIFAGNRRLAERISTADLLQELNSDDEKPWATYNRGKSMTPRQLAKHLGEYGVKAEVIRSGGSTFRGFLKAWFEDAFNRYLPGIRNSVTNENKPIMTGVFGVTHDPQPYRSESVSVTPNPLKINGCCTVTDIGGDLADMPDITL